MSLQAQPSLLELPTFWARATNDLSAMGCLLPTGSPSPHLLLILCAFVAADFRLQHSLGLWLSLYSIRIHAILMRRSPSNRSTHSVSFTLIELLLVVIILGVLSSLGVTKILSDKDSSLATVNNSKMLHLRDALVAFKRDMGYYPGYGPLGNTDNMDWPSMFPNIEDFSDGTHTDPSSWSLGNIHTQNTISLPLRANFWQLFIKPVLSQNDGENFYTYDAQIKYGWNGPYLTPPSIFYHESNNDARTYLHAVPDIFERAYSESLLSQDWFWAHNTDTAHLNRGAPYCILYQNNSYYLICNGPNGKLDSILKAGSTNELALNFELDVIMQLPN